MAAPKRPTHVVTHPSLYLRVNGKLQEMDVGAQLTLDDKQAAGMVEKNFIKSLKEAKQVDLDAGAEEKKD